MTMTDPVADYLTRLRNAVQAGHKKFEVPTSNLKREITKLLVDQKFVTGFTEVKEAPQGTLRVQLKYHNGQSVITGLRRISTPGLRKYVNSTDIPRVLGGLGIAIISTSRGLMSDRQAREAHVGGEVMCEIW
ncbi:MAG: 30S ribosomal protein S8 [Bacteroidota bacterium]